MPELHLLKMLFWATSAPKSTLFNAQLALFWCKSDSDLMCILVRYINAFKIGVKNKRIKNRYIINTILFWFWTIIEVFKYKIIRYFILNQKSYNFRFKLHPPATTNSAIGHKYLPSSNSRRVIHILIIGLIIEIIS